MNISVPDVFERNVFQGKVKGVKNSTEIHSAVRTFFGSTQPRTQIKLLRQFNIDIFYFTIFFCFATLELNLSPFESRGPVSNVLQWIFGTTVTGRTRKSQ